MFENISSKLDTQLCVQVYQTKIEMTSRTTGRASARRIANKKDGDSEQAAVEVDISGMFVFYIINH